MVELTNRETATLILFGLLIAAFLVVPNLRKPLLPAVGAVLKAAASWKLLLPIVLYDLYAFGLVGLVHRLGLWDSTVLKDTLIVVVFTGLPMLFRAMDVRDGSVLVKQIAGETVGVSAFLLFYLNLASLPLWGELFLQPAVTFFALLAIVAATSEEHAAVRKLCNFIVGSTSVGLLIFTTVKLVSDPGSTEFANAGASLAVAIWLPIALLPYVYVFAFVIKCESILVMLPFMNDRRPPPRRVKVAMILGFHFSTRLASELTGSWRGRVARATGFRETRSIMRELRSATRRRDDALETYTQTLIDHAGAEGVDGAGLVLDRREFAATKEALRGLYYNQLGQKQNRGRYQAELDLVLGSYVVKDLPDEHGIELRLNKGGKAWRAWRRTPSGYVFGTGGTASDLLYQWEYDGQEPPTGFPLEHVVGWVNANLNTSSDEWAQDDDAPTETDQDWDRAEY